MSDRFHGRAIDAGRPALLALLALLASSDTLRTLPLLVADAIADTEHGRAPAALLWPGGFVAPASDAGGSFQLIAEAMRYRADVRSDGFDVWTESYTAEPLSIDFVGATPDRTDPVASRSSNSLVG
jgi:hypothetical protein